MRRIEEGNTFNIERLHVLSRIMKKIIFTVTNDLTYDQRMHKICTSLSKAGYNVELVGRKLPSSKPLDNKTFGQTRLYCFFTKGKLFYIEYNLRLLFFLLFRKFDIICAIDLDTILPALFVGVLRSKKMVYDAHEYFTEVPEVINRPAVQKFWKAVERLAVPKMDLCYTVSNSLGEIFEQEYHKKFYIIKNVPESTEVNLSPEPVNFILYQGALNVGRGLEELILAMQQIPLRLKIVGEGDLSATLRKMVKDLNLQDKITFLGYMKPGELKELTPKAFLGYNLLADMGKSYYYSLSNKFFDYIHAGVPGISNNYPEYTFINNQYETAALTNLSVGNIVLTVNTLIKDKGYYNRLKQNCTLAAKVYNWQEEEKLLVNLYRGLR